MKTYFITGISGFLGRNIVLELLKKDGIRIVGLVLPNEEELDFFYQHEEIELVRGSILNSKDLDNFLAKQKLSDNLKNKIKQAKIKDYTGIATLLAKEIK